MELAVEEANFVRITKVVVDIVPKHLRQCFKQQWNKKYPNKKWNSDKASGDFIINELRTSITKNEIKQIYVEKLEKGEEQEWDTNTLAFALLDSGLKLIESCRPKCQRTSPFRISEGIEIIRDIRKSFFAHAANMSCSYAEVAEITAKIKIVAQNIFGQDAVDEIEEVMRPEIETQLSVDIEQKLEMEIHRNREYNNLVSQMKAELKEIYRSQYGKHIVHKVDINGKKIVLREETIDDFAVELKIIDILSPMDTFTNETRRYCESFEGMSRGKKIDVSTLLDSNERVTFIRGLAGMGKSVLSKQLAHWWELGKIYKDFELCIMFECRDINKFVANEGRHFETYELLNEFIKSEFKFDVLDGKRIFFLVDGLDELLDIKSNNSIIWQLLDIKNSKYSKSKVIITGRPHVEDKLSRNDRQMGGLQKVEIQGLSEEQIKDYIDKFACCENDNANIKKAKDSSERHLPIIHVPQFLNTFCCVAILTNGRKIRNVAELYCWTLYLLLKQHAGKDGPSEKRVSEIFTEYSREVLALSNICTKLLTENKIIFEGSITSEFDETGKGKEFLEGLFANVSDNINERYQFKHLSLMEFLCAVHICSIKKQMKLIKSMLENEFYEVVSFGCQLISGCNYCGIIKDLFSSAVKSKDIRMQKFLPETLRLVNQCMDNKEQAFQLSIEIIMSFMTNNVAKKRFILANLSRLHLDNNLIAGKTIKKVNKISEQLRKEYFCDEKDLIKAFKNVDSQAVIVTDECSLTVVRYLAQVKRIELHQIKTNASFIQKRVAENVKCKMLKIFNCQLEDTDEDELVLTPALDWFTIERCKLNKVSFFNSCKWGVSSVKDFRIWFMEGMWWEELIIAITKAKANKSKSFVLRKLDIFHCAPSMSEEEKGKIVKFGVELCIDGIIVDPTLQSEISPTTIPVQVEEADFHVPSEGTTPTKMLLPIQETDLSTQSEETSTTGTAVQVEETDHLTPSEEASSIYEHLGSSFNRDKDVD